MSIETNPQFETTRFTYEHFAEQPEYQEVNRDFFNKAMGFVPRQATPLAIVDIASGTGLGTKIYKEELGKRKQKAKIVGVDPNHDSVEVARRTILPSPTVSVKFKEGYGQDLNTLLRGEFPEGADVASILDAIHEIPKEEEKRQVLDSMADMLKPQGILMLNSAFTSKGMVPQTMAWGKWKLFAFNEFGKRPDKDIQAIKFHTPEEYRKMITSSGLRIIHEEERAVHLSKEALIAISLYPEFVEGVFRNMPSQEKYSLEDKSEALIKALNERKIQSLQRTWWEVVGQKPPAA